MKPLFTSLAGAAGKAAGVALCCTVLPAAALPAAALADGHQTEIVTAEHSFILTRVATGLEHPWGLDWLPDGRMVVTERPGRIRLVSPEGVLSEPLAGVPEVVSDFRDGLLDVSVSPDFASDRTLYIAYSNNDGEQRWLEVTAARLAEPPVGLEDLRVVFRSDVKVENIEGFGARIRFDAEGRMFVSVGDHAVPAEAQNRATTLGTLIRIDRSGNPVADNPGGDNPGGGLHPAVYAYGFKNPQGLAIDPVTGAVWAADHGPRGGGEINRVEAGANYGWPARTFGDRDGRPGAAAAHDFAEPVFTWGVAPTVALSGLEVYRGTDFPNWQGDLFAGSLTQEALIRVMLDDDGRVVGTEYVLDGDIGRVREVRQGPDRRLYVLNDDFEGAIYRLDP